MAAGALVAEVAKVEVVASVALEEVDEAGVTETEESRQCQRVKGNTWQLRHPQAPRLEEQLHTEDNATKTTGRTRCPSWAHLPLLLSLQQKALKSKEFAVEPFLCVRAVASGFLSTSLLAQLLALVQFHSA